MNNVKFLLDNFKLPPRYANLTWDSLVKISDKDKQFAFDYVEKFPNNNKESIYLSNRTSGTGKTSFAVCLTKQLILSGKLHRVPLFVSFRILLEHLRQTESFLNNDIFRRIKDASFIIFDDIGVERVNPSIADRYILIFEQLWLQKKPAIFTSKFTLNEFLNRGADVAETELLESVGSRLVGMCAEYVLDNVEDFRNGD